MWLPLFSVGILLVSGAGVLSVRQGRYVRKTRLEAEPFSDLATEMCQLTHGYLMADAFHRYLPRLQSNDDQEVSQEKAKKYLSVLGFRRKDQDDRRVEYPADMYWHPEIASKYTAGILPQTRPQNRWVRLRQHSRLLDRTVGILDQIIKATWR